MVKTAHSVFSLFFPFHNQIFPFQHLTLFLSFYYSLISSIHLIYMTSTEPLPMTETLPTESTIPHTNSSTTTTTTTTDKDNNRNSSLSGDEEVPLDKCRLTMLLVSGKRQVFDFDSHTTVDSAKTYILDHWPKGKIV